ncbi:Bax inhibitor-1/YccA family membrane protein [Thalassobacillus pellis]|uniref:Bax inhibitor-1/YccA family protein n=1 Tax=Thalassobacillus pellis TaxID=748008 RepID=UPI00195F70AE|nr:Bax inhibitor-1/YccA family protein [Thalassobacillus pellis]MBM7552960.1 putative YccA/Bax inhibitor family protein [Thalassobacillus pellis]
MRTANPALHGKTFSRYQGNADKRAMTLQGTVNKVFLLLIILAATAFYTWNLYFNGQPVELYLVVGLIGSLIFALITAFIPRIAPITAPVYAALEGLFIGAISAYYENLYEGIVMQAALLTIMTLFGLLIIYKLRIIKVTKNFRLGVVAATLGILLVYLADIILRTFTNMQVPLLHESSLLGIGISLLIVVVAALNLVLDFDFIEHASKRNVPKHMEWYGAFGLIVTLVWLYVEMLRLLAKLRNR